MEQYIPKSALVAEIKRLIDCCYKICAGNLDFLQKSYPEHYYSIETYKEILSFINTLEVKEVDLETSIDDYINSHFTEGCDGGMISDWYKVLGGVHYNDLKEIAKHFFELGIKAKDWEKERMEECPYRRVECTMYDGHILECKGACSWVVDYPKLKELKTQKGEDV